MDTALERSSDDVKIRFIQAIKSSGQQHTNQMQPAGQVGSHTTIPADDAMPAAVDGSSEGTTERELLRLLNMAGVLVTTPDGDDQPGQLDHSSINSGRFDDATVNEYAMLNEHLWRVFVLPKVKGAILPLVRNQLNALIASFGQSRGLSTHQRLCEPVSELSQLAGEAFFDADKYSEAAHCYTLSATAGKEAGAFDLWTCAMTRHARLLRCTNSATTKQRQCWS
ncbi:MAG: hypothetical protein JO364_09700 [Pseudonocardiales bacterium]|nr:hypothetical protein [Pseudonocardiales bacterium]MBV9030567.1 hypothetical protein [Pseudonocardiales bacterium]